MRVALAALLIAHGAAHVVGLVAALGFMLVGGGVLAGLSMRAWLLTMLLFSAWLCIVGWPEARIGLVVNAALLVALLAMPSLAVR